MLSRLSVDTLTELHHPLGGDTPLESRHHIRSEQHPEILARWIRDPKVIEGPAAPRCAPGFAYASADFMPVRDDSGALRFHLLELNGSGTRGISNLPTSLQETLYSGVAEAAGDIEADPPLLLFPFRAGSPSGLRYERALLAQALAAGLEQRHGRARLVWEPSRGSLPPGPTVAVGSSDDLRRALRARDRRMWLDERPVDAAFHDLFVQHLLDRFDGAVDSECLLPINPFFRVSANKATTYPLFDAFLDAPREATEGEDGAGTRDLLARTGFETAGSRDELLAILRRRVNDGIHTVIKPKAAGVARGIAFFLAPLTDDVLVERVDASIASVAFMTPERQPPRRAFPYAVCDLLDGATVPDPEHPLFGHRFELRIVLYRQDGLVRAFPSIAKVSGERYQRAAVEDGMLLNTVALSSSQAPGRPTEHALPLANASTLRALGVEVAEVERLCAHAVAFVDFIGRRGT